MPGALRFVLLARGYCHLCDEMKEALAPYAERMAGWLELDVDADPGLEARWGDYVPVLLLGEDEVCHYRLDCAALERALAAASAKSSPPGGKIAL